MNLSRRQDQERLQELLADEAAAALEAGDTAELARLLDHNPGVGRDELLEAAALAQVAFLRRAQKAPRSAAGAGHRIPRPGAMPAGLKERLATQGEAIAIRQRSTVVRMTAPAARPGVAREPVAEPVASSTSRANPKEPGARNQRRWSAGGSLGWALAAALAVAFVLVGNQAPAPTPDPVAARPSLVAEAPDAITLPWAPPDAAGYEGVRGEVVWSDSLQQGFLRLANMPVNDPARSQYQLWIVDPDRDKHPVDGGVFNVSSTGEVIIPIQARLPVRSPAAFAITAEKPGGVVVSAGPLLVVASS